jgi:hypothetical protein
MRSRQESTVVPNFMDRTQPPKTCLRSITNVRGCCSRFAKAYAHRHAAVLRANRCGTKSLFVSLRLPVDPLAALANVLKTLLNSKTILSSDRLHTTKLLSSNNCTHHGMGPLHNCTLHRLPLHNCTLHRLPLNNCTLHRLPLNNRTLHRLPLNRKSTGPMCRRCSRRNWLLSSTLISSYVFC